MTRQDQHIQNMRTLTRALNEWHSAESQSQDQIEYRAEVERYNAAAAKRKQDQIAANARLAAMRAQGW